MNRLAIVACAGGSCGVFVVVVDGKAVEFGTQRLEDERVALGRLAVHALRLGHRVGEGQKVISSVEE